MTTFPSIQPRPILCKTTTNNIQSSSPIYLLQSSTITNTNPDINTNNSSSQIPLSPNEEFLKRLREFHRGRQTSFRFLPTIAGQSVDLYLLYNTVVNHGGWDKVNDRQLWPVIANHFCIDSTCLNGTQALKNIYIRYLYAFEKITNGENVDLRDDENDDLKRRTISQLQRVPQSYNHTQHNVSDTYRNEYGLFNDFVRRNEYEKLELSLICGFPNDLTFTLNTLLLLSSSSSHTKSFHLYKCPRLLDLLYRHIGLFLSSMNDQSFQILYDQIWSKHFNYQMKQFWMNSCSPKIIKLLLNINIDDQQTIFNLNLNQYFQEQIFRIEQILMIIRNLSFDRLNALYFLDSIHSKSSITYKFFLLISYCHNNIQLQKYVYDIWTNLALYMNIYLINHDEGLVFRQLLNDMLNGNNDQEQQQDRFQIIRGLEILSNLAQSGYDNRIYLIEYVNIMIKSLLYIPDILILVHTLECLYQLSELGEQLCDAILNVQSSISIITTLIHLLTIEARSFSSQTIKTIKIVEMSSGPILLPSYHQSPQSQSILLQQQQQYLKPLTINGVNPSTNLLSIPTSSSTILSNSIDKKRKAISETISAVVNGTPSPKRLRPTPSIIRSSSIEDESNIIESIITDLVDRCSSSSIDNEINSCLNDLCQRVGFLVDQSLTNIYNQLPSPIFKRQIEKQTNQLITNKSLTDNNLKQSIEQQVSDIKPTISTSTLDYNCEWDNCRLSFSTPRSVFHHICSTHIKYLSDYICLWNGCERLKRQKWALISHIQERHCSDIAFRQAKHKITNPVPMPTNSSNSNHRSGTIAYAPDAAWLAIRRHMQINLFDDQIIKSKEGPLTKSIRLTAALILRNLARYSTIGKQNIRQYEQLIANLALESTEASQTLSSCLFELYN